jgi:NADH dehydrogenase FAD-containing subunit
MSATASSKVIIVGDGFGGLCAAQALKSAPVDVTLIDRRNYHLFQPPALSGRNRFAFAGRDRSSAPRRIRRTEKHSCLAPDLWPFSWTR